MPLLSKTFFIPFFLFSFDKNLSILVIQDPFANRNAVLEVLLPTYLAILVPVRCLAVHFALDKESF